MRQGFGLSDPLVAGCTGQSCEALSADALGPEAKDVDVECLVNVVPLREAIDAGLPGRREYSKKAVDHQSGAWGGRYDSRPTRVGERLSVYYAACEESEPDIAHEWVANEGYGQRD